MPEPESAQSKHKKGVTQTFMDAFHRHCDTCTGCAEGPTSTCKEGLLLLQSLIAASSMEGPTIDEVGRSGGFR